jgi:hypothetical protein
MNKQKHECTGHRITLCPDAKQIVKEKIAKSKRQTNISEVVNKIILEYGIKEDHKI